MSIQVALNHITHYRYDKLISLGPQTIRLRPAPHCRTQIESYSLKVIPEGHFLNWQQDPFGNYLARAVFPEKTKQFKVEVDLVSQVRIFNPFDFFLEEAAKEFPFTYEPGLAEELAPYLEIKEQGEKLNALVNGFSSSGTTIDFLVGINRQLNETLKYIIRMEPGVQSCEQTLALQSGSCRDMAWLLCQALRHLGLATRFASGYLIQLRADVKSLDGPSGPESDFTDLHAWTEVYLPGAGWIGLDPTSGLLAGENHIPLCCTPNPSSAAPITGILDDCKAELSHQMQVTRIREDRRITKPYSEPEWTAINHLGEKIDTDLNENDVRLTMGGEPTFVSLDDKESNEWKLGALGPDKWKRAKDLFDRLQAQFAKGPLLHFGQGKWYPGEILPRWAMGCFWRKDGEPIWRQTNTLCPPDEDNKATPLEAERFISALAANLGVPAEMVLSAREDTPYYLWKEGKLPAYRQALDSKNTFEKAERDRLRKLMDHDLNKPVGYVLPLMYSYERKQWITNRWQFEHLILTPGDSPVGFRLPMGSIPFVPEHMRESVPQRSPFAKLEELVSYPELEEEISKRSSDPPRADYLEKDPFGYVRTALCVEPRNGTLCVFLPPVTYVEHFLDLIASIEKTSNELEFTITIEGYEPPTDLRLKSFKVTPDPGVIEVNVQPIKSWNEQVNLTNEVYRQAREARLATDRFLLDGRRVGTGGGNHIIVGGETPDESPFLRRPSLLRSLLTFWQHHPSLSYLFSSLFIGPTSQHPRIDEARMDSLAELEIAFAQFPAKQKGEDVRPWLIDRLLRNLLVDVTGNTHRAEFSIDKLYSPDGNTGRLGLLELRNFEMPPHPKMSLVQSLLVRACIAGFWNRPYEARLIRWGTRLHDQFMLPYYIWNDFVEVLEHLKTLGYLFEAEWFSPHFEFRFPKVGKTQVGNVSLELRTALEPWPVMGEQGTPGGTSRAVDSSVERLQICVSGALRDFHCVTCNGRTLPLQPTQNSNEFVAGVRFKAWSPPSSLHPTIGAHNPLRFDVIDKRYKRSVGGCLYHVAHPGGRNYETHPVNENEAQGRRLARFISECHSPGKMAPPKLIVNPEFPCTLDLRLV